MRLLDMKVQSILPKSIILHTVHLAGTCGPASTVSAHHHLEPITVPTWQF